VVLLSDTLASDADFFVEQVEIVAIVFDNTDDVTVWATTVIDDELHFFHLALPFKPLDTLISLTADRADAVQEDVADALAAGEWPALLEYRSEEKPPLPLPSVALKLSVTYPAPAPDSDEEEAEEPEDALSHNIFYLEGIYVRLDS
jgi:hypothetical protein